MKRRKNVRAAGVRAGADDGIVVVGDVKSELWKKGETSELLGFEPVQMTGVDCCSARCPVALKTVLGFRNNRVSRGSVPHVDHNRHSARIVLAKAHRGCSRQNSGLSLLLVSFVRHIPCGAAASVR